MSAPAPPPLSLLSRTLGLNARLKHGRAQCNEQGPGVWGVTSRGARNASFKTTRQREKMTGVHRPAGTHYLDLRSFSTGGMTGVDARSGHRVKWLADDDADLGALLLAARGGDARNRARLATPHDCRQRLSGVQRPAGTRAQRTARTAGFLPFPRASSPIFALAPRQGSAHCSSAAADQPLRLAELRSVDVWGGRSRSDR